MIESLHDIWNRVGCMLFGHVRSCIVSYRTGEAEYASCLHCTTQLAVLQSERDMIAKLHAEQRSRLQ